MVELFQKRQQCKKPFPLLNLTRPTTTNASTNGYSSSNKTPTHQLGSGITSPMITNSIMRNNDPYMPHIISPRSHSSASLPSQQQQQHPVFRRSTNSSSTPHLVTHHGRQPVTPTNNEPQLQQQQQIHHHHHYYLSSPPVSPTFHKLETAPFYNLYQQQPPLSPPPLSPTNVSFSASRPSWRDIKRSPTWQPASSISSSEEDDDDDEPLFHLTTPTTPTTRPFSLLSDASEDGDDELIPIARLSSPQKMMSAAEKYKAKVRAKLQMDTTTTTIV